MFLVSGGDLIAGSFTTSVLATFYSPLPSVLCFFPALSNLTVLILLFPGGEYARSVILVLHKAPGSILHF